MTLWQERPKPQLPQWQEQWKGGFVPLHLMRKPLPVAAIDGDVSSSGAAVAPAKRFDEFSVTLEQVLQYEDAVSATRRTPARLH